MHNRLLPFPRSCNLCFPLQLYLFNVGVFDAKGMHHPTVYALEYGLAYPRHKVVGRSWQHAHEWVRLNLSRIVSRCLSREKVDIVGDMGIGPECFEGCIGEVTASPSWTHNFEGLGECTFAFPSVKMSMPSFQRVLSERGHLCCTSDGDHNMWQHLSEGLGEGRAQVNRSGNTQHIDSCSFHKFRNIEARFDKDIKLAQAARVATGINAWDCKYPAGFLLHTDRRPSYHALFGDLLDEVMQHDVLAVAHACWGLAMRKGRLLGLTAAVKEWNKLYHPTNGSQGVWGRANRTYEVAEVEDTQHHVLASTSMGITRMQNKGDSTSANPVEARVNKRVSRGIRTSLPMGRLGNELSGIFCNLSRECIGTAGFSQVPDFMGRCEATTSRMVTGRPGKKGTTRNFSRIFQEGMHMAFVKELQKRHLKRLSGVGRESKYIVASELCVREAENIVRYENNSGCPNYEARVESALQLMRCSIACFCCII